MKPSELAKKSGLTGLSQMSKITKQSNQTLINWSKNKPDLFNVVIKGCVETAKELNNEKSVQ